MTPCPKCNTLFEQKEITIGERILKYPFECPQCALETTKRLEDEAKATLDREEALRVSRWLENSNIPLRYRDIKNYESKNGSQKLTWDFKKNLIFYGGTGAGKTYLACFVAIVGIRKYRKTARYITHFELVRRIKSTWSSKSVSEDEVINDLINCDVLIIDEIDKQEHTPYLFQVMDGRYNASLPTIIIGNATLDEIKAILGEALSSRLRGGGTLVKEFAAIDYRKEKQD